MKVGVIGLGLIGGSLAKAATRAGHTAYGYDTDAAVIASACRDGAISAALTLPAGLAKLDLLLVALYPAAAIATVRALAADIRPGTLVIDCCGTKGNVCAALMPLAKEKGFSFIGGHPMAGRERFGYDASTAGLFEGASMVLTPPEDVDAAQLVRAEAFFRSLGFARMRVCTAAEHDRMIAYTSQLAHVVSSAYVQSPAALAHVGFSAGSFQDMTRVARLYEPMWTELFLDNAEPLAAEIDGLIERLQAFSIAIRGGERERLYAMLHAGRARKEYLNERENEA